MKKIVSIIISLILVLSFTACGSKSKENASANLLDKDWNYILEKAKGTAVNFYGFGGNEATNRWLDGAFTNKLKEKYNIKFKRVPMDIEDIINKLSGEKQAESNDGSIDIVWINGENFYTAKNSKLLFGPFDKKLPNYNKYIDKNAEDIKNDFGLSTEGYEAPFGRAEFVMAYDKSKIKNFPKNHEELFQLIKSNKGKFTYPAPPDFTGSAFVRNIIYDVVGYEKLKNLDADKEKIEKTIKPAIDYLKKIKPYLWKEGETYPSTAAMIENMYSDKQIINTMTYHPNSIIEKINNGQYTKTTKASLFDKGNIGNTNFLAIPFNSTNKVAAMVAINEMLSFEMQKSKYDSKIWGDLPIFDNNKLSDKEKEEIKNINTGDGSIPQSILQKNRLPELKAEIIPIIEKIWLENIPGED